MVYAVRFNNKIAPCPLCIFKIRVSVAANSDKKSQGCLHAIEHASAFSHTHCITTPTVLICVADGAGVEGYVQ